MPICSSVPLDNERRWYRYHHLFADLLRQRLRQTHQDWESELHIQASAWYEQNGFADYAIEHALYANDFERAAHLIEEQSDAIWVRGEHSRLQRWLAELPEAWLCSQPQLCIYHAWFLFSTGQEEAGERILQAVEQLLNSNKNQAIETASPEMASLSTSARTKLQGRLSAIRAMMGSWWEDVPGIIHYASQALEYLSKDDPWRGTAAVALGDAYSFKGDMKAACQARLEAVTSARTTDDLFLFMIANLKVATSLKELGRLQETIEICQQQLEFARENNLSQTIFAGWATGLWGLSLAEQNELDRALELATKSVELTKDGDLTFCGFSNMVLAKVLFYKGDFAGAARVLQKLADIAQKHYLPLYISEPLAAWKARIWLAQNQLEPASQWVKARKLHADGELTSLLDYVIVVLARILLAQARLDEAARLLNRLLEAAESGGHTARTIEILVLQALTFQAGNNITQAKHALKRALTLAEPGWLRSPLRRRRSADGSLAPRGSRARDHPRLHPSVAGCIFRFRTRASSTRRVARQRGVDRAFERA